MSANRYSLFDRGYPTLWLMGLLEKQGFKYCIRLITAWRDAVRSVSGNETDVDWSGKRRSNKDTDKL